MTVYAQHGFNTSIRAHTGRASVEHRAPFAAVSSVPRLCTKTPQFVIFSIEGATNFVLLDWSIDSTTYPEFFCDM